MDLGGKVDLSVAARGEPCLFRDTPRKVSSERPFPTILMTASRVGLEILVRHLLATEQAGDINKKDEVGSTALIYAASSSSSVGNDGNEAIITLLLENGADINSQDCYGRRALSEAVIRRKLRIALLVLDRGADPNILAMSDPLLVSCARDDVHYPGPPMLKHLLEHGADAQAKDADRQTAV